MDTYQKYNKLKEILGEQKSIAVAFSGGVDSTFLLKVAYDVLGENAIALTADLSSFAENELSETKKFCQENEISQEICCVNEFEIPGFSQNPPDRCYICKKVIFTNLWKTAREKGIRMLAEGSNMDDCKDYRPGRKAVKELKVRSPLQEAGLYKDEIRQLSKELNLPTWKKPSFACLASRFVYGETITREKLLMVQKAEAVLRELGFIQYRVRIHGMIARIEVPENDIGMLIVPKNRKQITERFKKLGFTYITVDLQGFRSGSMNEIL